MYSMQQCSLLDQHRCIFILDFSLYADVSTFGRNLACLAITINLLCDFRFKAREASCDIW